MARATLWLGRLRYFALLAPGLACSQDRPQDRRDALCTELRAQLAQPAMASRLCGRAVAGVGKGPGTNNLPV